MDHVRAMADIEAIVPMSDDESYEPYLEETEPEWEENQGDED